MEHKTMSIKWSSEDIQMQAKDMDIKLSVEESIEILERMMWHHDCTLGINWDVIWWHISDFDMERKRNSPLI